MRRKILAVIWIVSVLFSSPLLAADYTYYVPFFKADDNYWTGLGLRNCSDVASAAVTAEVYDANGSKASVAAKHLAARGQISFVVGADFCNEGWIRITSTQVLSGLCFFATKGAENHMADIPFVSTLETLLVVPNVGQGPNFDTCIMVCNPNNQVTTVTLRLVNQTGTVVSTEVNEVAANGSWKYALFDMVADSSVGNMGSVEISATNGVAAFALYDNLKTGGYCFAGISAETLPSGGTQPSYSGQYIGGMVGTPVDESLQWDCGHASMDIAISGTQMTGYAILQDDTVLTLDATVTSSGNIARGTISEPGEGVVASFWGLISDHFISGNWLDLNGCSGMWCAKKQ